MRIKVQFTDGAIVTISPQSFYDSIKGKDVFHFKIGSADFYNHDFYSLHFIKNLLFVKEWNPPGTYHAGPHACEYRIRGPHIWIRKQYGVGCDQEEVLPYERFLVPEKSFWIGGKLVDDLVARRLFNEFPITRLKNYSMQMR